jgi:hypothetical protein
MDWLWRGRKRHRRAAAYPHISDEDLERYHLGMITEEGELARVEDHLLVCAACVYSAEASNKYVDGLRSLLCLHEDTALTRPSNRQNSENGRGAQTLSVWLRERPFPFWRGVPRNPEN